MIESKKAGDNVRVDDYNYKLPDEKIAKYPSKERNQSKLLVFKNNKISEDVFTNLPAHLPLNSILIFNNTKVIQARMIFHKKTGARIEIFCLEPVKPGEYNLAFLSNNKVLWKCIVGNLRKWKNGPLIHSIEINGTILNLKATLIKKNINAQEIEFTWDNPEFTFSDIIELFGTTPIPPYLNRESEEIDIERYQTIYSKIQGSVAAPTAGLHFIDEVFHDLEKRKIRSEEITLHVGAGTFKPVQTDTIDKHEMHTEFFSVSKNTIINLLNHHGPIISVGTTSMRTIESLFWIGVKILNRDFNFHINQWEPYQLNVKLTLKESFQCILNYLDNNNIDYIQAKTQMIIVPGYEFKVNSGLITNYHMPKSTLLMLVAAFVGENWKDIYSYALENNFRFLSYGDSSLLMKSESDNGEK